MGCISPRVDPAPLADALIAGARAAIAFDCNGEVEAVPVLCRIEGDRLWIGVARESAPPASSFGRVVLVLDDGRYWFELRAHTWRGRIEAVDGAPSGATDDIVWLCFIPSGAIAWNYGALREEPSA